VLPQCRIALWVAIAGILTQAGAATTSLGLYVGPEARVSPASVPITFEVSDAGVVTPQPVMVEAWFRAMPDQTTSLKASISDLAGPVTVPGSVVQWAAFSVAGTGGGKTSQCCSWATPGTATLRIAFSTSDTQGWKPGVYSGRVDFRLLAGGR
jgi:hypothetical protein